MIFLENANVFFMSYEIVIEYHLLTLQVHLLQILILQHLSATCEAQAALSCYGSFHSNVHGEPIWAVAENYRFEPAFVEVLLDAFL